MPYPTERVADFFLAKAKEDGMPITQMKLQKLVYLAQGWHAAINDERLVAEEVQAWPWGPVFRSLYDRFKRYGRHPIDVLKPHPPELDSKARRILEGVWQRYSRFSAYQLSDMTHKEGTPWYQVWESAGGKHIRGAIVPFDRIREHFGELLDQARRRQAG